MGEVIDYTHVSAMRVHARASSEAVLTTVDMGVTASGYVRGSRQPAAAIVTRGWWYAGSYSSRSVAQPLGILSSRRWMFKVEERTRTRTRTRKRRRRRRRRRMRRRQRRWRWWRWRRWRWWRWRRRWGCGGAKGGGGGRQGVWLALKL